MDDTLPVTEPTVVAGLALLHEYLPVLFKRMDIKIDGDNIDDADLPLALSALNGLTSNTDKTDPINAVLLGVSMERLADVSNAELSLAQLDDIDQMYQGLLHTAEVFSSTSRDGFVQTFVIRTGQIECQEDRNILRVDRGPYDMLLEQLPWSNGVVKLSWMRKVLHLEWY